MEKVVVVLRRTETNAEADDAWCARLRGPVAQQLLDLELPGVLVNVKDAAVRASLMTLTTLDPPAVAVVSLWTQQCYGTATVRALGLLAAECDLLAAYLVTESVPMAPPTEIGLRTEGLANVALLRRPAELAPARWRHLWHIDHTPVAIATQATFGYVQNEVVHALSDDAPELAAIVEEQFPAAAVSDLRAFFGAADDADLQRRLAAMTASTGAFGANAHIDTVPTSRYPLRWPFA